MINMLMILDSQNCIRKRFKIYLVDQIIMALLQIEECHFKKQYDKISSLCSSTNDFQDLIVATLSTRVSIYKLLTSKEEGWCQMVEKQKDKYQSILQNKGNSVDLQIIILFAVTMEYFVFEIVNSSEVAIEEEKRLLKLLDKLPTSTQFSIREEIWKMILSSLILSTSFMELQIKRIIAMKRVANLSDLHDLKMKLRQIAYIHPVAYQYCKKAFTILTHLKLYTLNVTARQNERFIAMIKIVLHDGVHPKTLFSQDTKIVLLYNCLKTLLGAKQMSDLQEDTMQQLYKSLKIKPVHRYEEHLLHLFFVVKGLIFAKGKVMEGDGEDSDQEDGEQDRVMTQKFSTWVSINLDETMLSLEEVSRNIIRHRVASLATLISMKLSLPRFCLNFLELMHDGPFNNDAQTIKLCFELFQARQFSKLNNPLQIVLSAASCKDLRERQVLLSMCGIFTGMYLQNRQQALLYAKLNHSQNKKHILREETLLQQIGFAYYNLAIHEIYLCNRETFLLQANNNLSKSIKLNPDNYLVHYCLANIYTRQFEYDLAYKHIMECCKSGRGQWVPFSLLACIYFCQRRVTKATLIIQQLLKKYTNTKLLHYFRAYLQVNRLLLDVEYDEEVEAAKVMGEDIYQLCKDRILKAKTPTNLLKYCQEYHQLSLGVITTAYDENYFMQSMILNPDANMETIREGVGYQQGEGQQSILQIIPLLLQAGQTTITENLIKVLPASPLKTFYKAVLHENKKQKGQAILEYKSVLMQQPYHTPTLINLAMIDEDICDALHYIDVAEKFTKEGKLWLAKGLLLSKLGRITQANELFLRQGEQGWLQLQPDLIYYY